MTQSGHGAAIGTYVKLSIAPDHILSGADFPVFIVIDDKGNDVFKDLNLG